MNLVWEKASKPVPPTAFFARPAVAFALSAVVLIYGLWALQRFILIPEKSAHLNGISSVRGVVLEVGGAMAKGMNPDVQEGDRFVTDESSELTFFFPGTGYFHLAKNSRLSIQAARQELDEKHFRYELSLEQGALYSKLSKLESGTVLQYRTSYGLARVVGTEFALEVKKNDGMAINVLKGTVEVSSVPKPEQASVSSVQAGFRGFISASQENVISIQELKDEQKVKLQETFEHIFSKEVMNAPHERAIKGIGREKSFRILTRKEE